MRQGLGFQPSFFVRKTQQGEIAGAAAEIGHQHRLVAFERRGRANGRRARGSKANSAWVRSALA